MLLKFISNYVKHRFTSNTRHGTHSPFVYRLADEVIYSKTAHPEFKLIEEQRQVLLNDTREIKVVDLGAGSLLNANKLKSVKKIAKNALKSPKLAQLLYRIVQERKPSSIIELGTCLGITTLYLANSYPEVTVVTVEGCPNTAKIAKESFNKFQQSNINLKVGDFDDLFASLIQNQAKLDVVYIDGNHRKEATLRYFNQCLPKCDDDTLLIFDDIYWSQGMMDAWNEIQNHPSVTVTVDLFWIGLVYFKKGQAKEHFKLRI